MDHDHQVSSLTRTTLLIISCLLLSIGDTAAPIFMRLYFFHGGKRLWLSSCLQTGGWPIILIPLLVSYYIRRKSSQQNSKLFNMKFRLFIACVVIGILTGLDGYLYAYGMARLPVSTSELIIASQLAFTAVFAFFMVKQKFNFYSFNAVVVITIGAGVLATNGDDDRPNRESNKEYVMGFVMTLGAAILYGFILPLMELTCKKARQRIGYTLVLETQMMIGVVATIFCTVGMIVNNDFQVIGREAREFELGETRYYIIMVWTGIIWQFFNLGVIGVIFTASSLLSGIIIAVLLPVTEILAVICFKEKFRAEKGISLLLSVWGFVSYFHGEIKQSRKRNHSLETQMSQLLHSMGNGNGNA